MFTGIIQSIGTIKEPGNQLVIEGTLPYDPPTGGSIAVSGCCLTRIEGKDLTFDLTEETLNRTTLGQLETGDKVNLEAALREGDPMGGHFVQGHVDSRGKFLQRDGERFYFEAPPEGAQFLFDKGSICIDGVSLTLIEPRGPRFTVSLIPHTLESTTLGLLREGQEVNLEYDVLAKYALRNPLPGV